ncbi:MAG: hypothetical protein KDD70_05420 [Bdellovibrionales bacterium]|nr:hypothetical protein [Bdellovibrionales bacterium]
MSKKHHEPHKPLMRLFDNKPLLNAWLPFIYCVIAGLLLLPEQLGSDWRLLSPESLFWGLLGVLIYWILALVENFELKKFLFVLAGIGTLVGIPLAIDLTLGGDVVKWIFDKLGVTAPHMNAAGYLVLAIFFFFPQLVWNYIWSRMQTYAELTSSELRIKRFGQKQETYELIGLKTIHEPIDYLEAVPFGAGAFAIAQRSGKVLFEMRRIVGLYRSIIVFWKPGKMAQIEALIAGTNINATTRTKAEIVSEMDAAADGDDPDDGDEGGVDHDDTTMFGDERGGEDEHENPEIK